MKVTLKLKSINDGGMAMGSSLYLTNVDRPRCHAEVYQIVHDFAFNRALMSHENHMNEFENLVNR